MAYCRYSERNLTPYSGNSARTSNHFSAMFFSQDKENERRRTSVLQAKFDAVFGKTGPNLKSFFGDVFFARQGFQAAAVYTYRKAQETKFYGRNSARTSNHFSVMFFRKTRLLSRRCIRIPQGERNEVLRKNSPKNQISIMSASFFFAISSISLTYLSVIF